MKRLAGFLLCLLLVSIAFYLARPYIFTFMADYLYARDSLDRADLIIVLGGDNNGERVAEAVTLYQAGYAPRLLMSGGPLAWHLTNAQWMKKQAVESGVPAGAIAQQDRSLSTLDDALLCLPLAKQFGCRTVILVTSPYHSRRASIVFKKVFAPEGIRVISYPVRQSVFNPDKWWTRYEDMTAVVWEYAANVIYFLRGY
ncbi:MAG: YdcF family protein [Candidatus Margulisiibacteriota bacterium]